MKERPCALISACLLGVACRYDGCAMPARGLEALMDRLYWIPVCPEQLGGLPTPRPPAERLGDRVITRDGADVSAAFSRGADEAVRLAGLFGARYALLKARSPSCGSGEIYDGSFSGRTVPGDGLTAQRLRSAGMQVFTEAQIDALLRALEVQES